MFQKIQLIYPPAPLGCHQAARTALHCLQSNEELESLKTFASLFTGLKSSVIGVLLSVVL